MIALSHATSRVLPNSCIARYTPGLHGRPSTILIGARDSETPVGGRASTSKLSSLAGMSPVNAVSNSFGVLPSTHSCGISCSLLKGSIATFGDKGTLLLYNLQ